MQFKSQSDKILLKLHTLKAESGDCLVLEFGKTKSKYILIDGGPGGVYDQSLQPFLTNLGYGTEFELVVASHVDDDHMNGLVDLLTSLKGYGTKLIEIKEIWYNSLEYNIKSDGRIESKLKNSFKRTTRRQTDNSDVRKSFQKFWDEAADEYFLESNKNNGVTRTFKPLKTKPIFAKRSIRQGECFRDQAEKLNIPINKSFNYSLITLEHKKPTIEIDNLRIEIIGPSQKYLDRLLKKWLEWVEKNVDKLRSETVRGVSQDQSIPNLSSIMFLAYADGKSILFTGDGREDHIIEGLKARNLLNNDGILKVDVLKLPHHGSNYNVSPSFFETVQAKYYVASGNDDYDNPHSDTLAMIAKAARKQNRKITIYVTYNNTKQIKKFCKKCPKAKFDYEIKTVEPKENYFSIGLS